MLIKLKREPEAIESYDQALAIQPDYAPAYYQKAISHAHQGQVHFSLDNLEKAIALNPAYRQEARTDLDFDAITQDDRFWRLIEQ